MDFEFSADQELLRDSVRRFLAEQAPISPYVRDRLDDDARHDRRRCGRGLADLGVVGLLVPEAHGGAGMGMVDAAVVLEELGRRVYPGPYASSAIGAVSLVDLAGDDARRDALLPGLATGERSAPSRCSSRRTARWHEPETHASRDGDVWRLDGEQGARPRRVGADVVLVVRGRRRRRRSACSRSTPDAAGVDASPPTPTVDGTRKQGAVDARRRAGAPARRRRRRRTRSPRPSTGSASPTVVDGVGAAARALELAVEYAKEREQFDAPIGSFQAVQHLCADMLRVGRAGARRGVLRVLGRRRRRRRRAAPRRDDGARRSPPTRSTSVGATAIQVFGGVGFTWEHDIHLFYKRLLDAAAVRAAAPIDQLEELASLILD